MSDPNKPANDQGTVIVAITLVAIAFYLLSQFQAKAPVVPDPVPAIQPAPSKPKNPKRPSRCPLCNEYHVIPTTDCPR